MKSCVMLWLSDMPPLHLYVYFAEFRDDSESESRGKSRLMKARCPAKRKSCSCMCVCYVPLWAFIEDISPTLQSSERHGRRGRCSTKRKLHPCMCKCYVPLWALWLPTIKFALQSSERHERKGLEAALPEGVPFHMQIQNRMTASLQQHERECSDQLKVGYVPK